MSQVGTAAVVKQLVPSSVLVSLHIPEGANEAVGSREEVRLEPEISEVELRSGLCLGWHVDDELTAPVEERLTSCFAESGPFQIQLSNPSREEAELGWELRIYINFLPVDMGCLNYGIPVARIWTRIQDRETAQRFTELLLERWMKRTHTTEWCA